MLRYTHRMCSRAIYPTQSASASPSVAMLKSLFESASANAALSKSPPDVPDSLALNRPPRLTPKKLALADLPKIDYTKTGLVSALPSDRSGALWSCCGVQYGSQPHG